MTGPRAVPGPDLRTCGRANGSSRRLAGCAEPASRITVRVASVRRHYNSRTTSVATLTSIPRRPINRDIMNGVEVDAAARANRNKPLTYTQREAIDRLARRSGRTPADIDPVARHLSQGPVCLALRGVRRLPYPPARASLPPAPADLPARQVAPFGTLVGNTNALRHAARRATAPSAADVRLLMIDASKAGHAAAHPPRGTGIAHHPAS